MDEQVWARSVPEEKPVELPPVWYVPCMEVDGELRVMLRRMEDGRVALVGYTALDRLRDGIGDCPWVLLNADGLQQVHDLSPFDLFLYDLDLLGDGGADGAEGGASREL
ncbi:SAV_915 family protein [Austwickia chelonae]|uniref:SAV_915 family protein n=1 Tax=Austwickia chelonae TaxID=100225 RepID=UPI000E253A1A|nr:SAV_915 family protein [Austwickia chelonae]